ncbi:MAG: PilZ domain-containing protein [Rhodospirillaceae bacterium]
MVAPIDDNKRRDPRFAVSIQARTVVDGVERAAVVRDVSVGGARLEADDVYTNDTFVEQHA